MDYEKGNPSWDISIILTRHHPACRRVESLRSTAGMHLSAADRLTRAHAEPCNCGAGESSAEHTTERQARRCQATSPNSPARALQA
jgi:hypothetical protein